MLPASCRGEAQLRLPAGPTGRAAAAPRAPRTSAAPGRKEATSHPESGEGAPASSRTFARHHRGCPLCLFRRTMRRPSSASVQVLQRSGGVGGATAEPSSSRRSCTRPPRSRDGVVKVGTARWRTVSLGLYRRRRYKLYTCENQRCSRIQQSSQLCAVTGRLPRVRDGVSFSGGQPLSSQFQSTHWSNGPPLDCCKSGCSYEPRAAQDSMLPRGASYYKLVSLHRCALQRCRAAQ